MMNAEFFVSVSALWMSVAGMYVYGYFTTKVTSQIQSIGDQMYNTEWIRYPVEYCRFVQLTISRSQRSLYFHGFGLINCDLVTFSKVTKKIHFINAVVLTTYSLRILACKFVCFILSHVQAHEINGSLQQIK